MNSRILICVGLATAALAAFTSEQGDEGESGADMAGTEVASARVANKFGEVAAVRDTQTSRSARSEEATRTTGDGEARRARGDEGVRRARGDGTGRRSRLGEEVARSSIRLPGPPRVALQAGHWKSAEAPDEQSGLRGNGTRGGGKQEWEVNLEIARKTAALLETAGYVVEILPTTIPPDYRADVFVAIHADGNPNPAVSGFRAAAPGRDRTGRAEEFADLLEETYARATGLRHYPTVTRRMRYYYAFNSRRYEHSLDPRTIGVIIETGFLTSPTDRRIIVDAQDRAARGLADGIKLFVETMPIEPRVASTGSFEPPTYLGSPD